MLVAGFLGLIVNLRYMGRFLPSGDNQIIVLVDSPREAAILRLLRLAGMIPRLQVSVIRQSNELQAFAENSATREVLSVATSQLYSKHYQVMTGLRRRLRLIVL